MDFTLIVCVIAPALQLVPLPRSLRLLAFPEREAVHSQLFVGAGAEWQTLSLDPWATIYAIVMIGAAVSVFWTCRYLCGTGHAHRVTIAVSVIGLLAALAAIAQHAGDPTKIYGVWQPVDVGARPFGPFVNRNHFATWAVMAIPLAMGSVVGSFVGRRASPFVVDELATLMRSLGSRGPWVAVSAAIMSLALFASTSRSGLIAFGLSLAAGIVIARRRFDRRTGMWFATGLVLLIGFVLAYGRLDPLISRAEETLLVGTGGRREIWNDTLAMIGDFWIAGTGLGAYQTAMLAYPQTTHLSQATFVNQAHNQYLQLLAEGGLLLVVPAALALVAFVRLFLTRLKRDTSPLVWLRIGGVVGLIALAVQSCWETGLRMPANGILFAVTAAIAVHRPHARR